MDTFRKVSMGQLAIIVGIVTAVAWIAIGGTVALVVSIVAGGLVALRGTMPEGAAVDNAVDD